MKDLGGGFFTMRELFEFSYWYSCDGTINCKKRPKTSFDDSLYHLGQFPGVHQDCGYGVRYDYGSGQFRHKTPWEFAPPDCYVLSLSLSLVFRVLDVQ